MINDDSTQFLPNNSVMHSGPYSVGYFFNYQRLFLYCRQDSAYIGIFFLFLPMYFYHFYSIWPNTQTQCTDMKCKRRVKIWKYLLWVYLPEKYQEAFVNPEVIQIGSFLVVFIQRFPNSFIIYHSKMNKAMVLQKFHSR